MARRGRPPWVASVRQDPNLVAPDAHLLLDDLKVILPSTRLGIIDDEVGQALGLSDIVTLPEIPPKLRHDALAGISRREVGFWRRRIVMSRILR